MKINKEIYELTQTIYESESMQMETFTDQQAIDVINQLRLHIKTLIRALDSAADNANKIKRIAKMYQKIDDAKERVFKDSVYDIVIIDYDSATSSDARNKEFVKAVAIEAPHINVNAEDADPDVFNA